MRRERFIKSGQGREELKRFWRQARPWLDRVRPRRKPEGWGSLRLRSGQATPSERASFCFCHIPLSARDRRWKSHPLHSATDGAHGVCRARPAAVRGIGKSLFGLNGRGGSLKNDRCSDVYHLSQFAGVPIGKPNTTVGFGNANPGRLRRSVNTVMLL